MAAIIRIEWIKADTVDGKIIVSNLGSAEYLSANTSSAATSGLAPTSNNTSCIARVTAIGGSVVVAVGVSPTLANETQGVRIEAGKTVEIKAQSGHVVKALQSSTTSTSSGAGSFGPSSNPRVIATFTRPASVTQYSDKDIIANSGTAASVVPLTFTVGGVSGYITGARAIVQAASGSIVTAGLDFDLYVFRPVSGIPFAAGSYPADNAALAITAAAMRQVVATFRFSSGSWTTEGDAGFQSVSCNKLSKTIRAV